MTTPVRLAKNLTARFISERPSEIVLERSARVSDGKGGWTRGTPVQLASQTVRLVGSVRLSATTQFTTADGSVVVPTHTLIAMDDADVQRFDRFFTDGRWHEVGQVVRIPNWRTQADVVQESA